MASSLGKFFSCSDFLSSDRQIFGIFPYGARLVNSLGHFMTNSPTFAERSKAWQPFFSCSSPPFRVIFRRYFSGTFLPQFKHFIPGTCPLLKQCGHITPNLTDSFFFSSFFLFLSLFMFFSLKFFFSFSRFPSVPFAGLLELSLPHGVEVGVEYTPFTFFGIPHLDSAMKTSFYLHCGIHPAKREGEVFQV